MIVVLVISIGTPIGSLPAGAGYGAGEVEAATVSSTEYRAFWYSFYDYDSFRENNQNNVVNFRNYFNNVVKNGKKLGMNTIIVHVRPFSDAIYKSSYFPWSVHISGKQGKSPGYDPLQIMVQVAHLNGMKIEAWINPYRVTKGTTNYNRLSPKNPARVWHNTPGKRRNVLSYLGNLYYNPARKDVRDLITKGAVELVTKYDVDGIHMDDYFYPPFSGSNLTSAFDAKEYNKSTEKRMGKSIVTFRRNQVNKLVRQMYKAIKAAKPTATFGISPAGEYKELLSKYNHYADFRTWLRKPGYVDYITPQVYWGFSHPIAPYAKITDYWVNATKNSSVKLYIGIAVYKSGHYVGASSKEIREWRNDTKVLQKQIIYGRNKNVDGFAFFDYSDLVSSTSKKAVKNLKKELKK
jgi:uncharacterized lipoprotein YddW (UPF0748 family)